MLVDEIILGTFFRLLNFFIIVAGCVYLFKHYGYNAVAQMMDAKESVFKYLRAQKVDVRRRDKDLDLQLHEQQELCQRLKQSVDSWKHSSIERKKEIKREQHLMQGYMENIRLLQGRAIVAYKIQHQVIPVALKKAQHSLEKKFASQEEGQKFIRMLLGTIKKGAQ